MIMVVEMMAVVVGIGYSRQMTVLHFVEVAVVVVAVVDFAVVVVDFAAAVIEIMVVVVVVVVVDYYQINLLKWWYFPWYCRTDHRKCWGWSWPQV